MMHHQDMQKLLEAPLFSGASAEAVTRWLQRIPGSCMNCSPGQVVHFQGDRYDQLILLISGTADARFQDLSGKIMRIETLKGPDAVASAILFSSEQILPVTVTAETELRLISVPRDLVISLLQSDPKILENLLLDMGDRLAFLAEKVRYLRFASLRQKIAGYLLQQADRAGDDQEIRVNYTREKLAEMFGVERPSLSRELSRMVDEGLIAISGRYVSLRDRESLEEYLQS